jgi:hypothetical protein
VWYLKSVPHVDSPMVKETTLSPAPFASFVVKRRRFWWPPRGEGMSNPRSPSAPVNELHVLYYIMNTTEIYTQSVKKKRDLFVTARLITPDCILKGLICYCKTDNTGLHFRVQVSGFSKLFRKKCEDSWLAKTLKPVLWIGNRIRIDFGRLDPSQQMRIRIQIQKGKYDPQKRKEISCFEVLDFSLRAEGFFKFSVAGTSFMKS